MGCATSKEGQNRETAYSLPLARSFSLPVHHPAEKKGDSYHVVALTSSTYGILKMDPVKEHPIEEDYLPKKEQFSNGLHKFRKNLDRSSEMATKTLSEVNNLLFNSKPFKGNLRKIGEKAPQEEPETINTWELMEGLEDNGNSPLTVHHNKGYRNPLDRSFSFHSVKNAEELIRDEQRVSGWHRVAPAGATDANANQPCKMLAVNLTTSSETESRELLDRRSLQNGVRSTDPPSTPTDSTGRPLWMHLTDDSTPVLFDPELISTFRKALDEISPKDTAESVADACSNSCRIGEDEIPSRAPAKYSRLRSSSFQARLQSFQQRIDEGLARTNSISKVSEQKKKKLRAPPGGENKVVLYVTSLRGIRKTFEDCCTVKLILQGFRVSVDERDISMHSGFRQELRDILGKPLAVPRLFIGGKYIGGAEEIQQLHEVGGLAKHLEGFPVHASLRVCDGCGDMRFVLCPNCNGSCKIFTEEHGFIRCSDCNENGLIRCPLCC